MLSGAKGSEALFMVFQLDCKGANARKSCRSRQELSNEHLVFTFKNRRRYSRGRSSQGLEEIQAIFLIRLLTEVALQLSLDHPHICRVYDCYEDRKCYYIVLELCEGGELFDRIQSGTCGDPGGWLVSANFERLVLCCIETNF